MRHLRHTNLFGKADVTISKSSRKGIDSRTRDNLYLSFLRRCNACDSHAAYILVSVSPRCIAFTCVSESAHLDPLTSELTCIFGIDDIMRPMIVIPVYLEVQLVL